MAHSGVRPGVLGAYQGENGLRLSDLPDLRLGRSGPEFAEVPFVIRVPANLSKTRVAYITFGTAQLASTFLAYLEQRRDSGEVLGPASPVVAANPMRGIARRSRDEAPRSKGFLTTKVVVEEIRAALGDGRARWGAVAAVRPSGVLQHAAPHGGGRGEDHP